MSPPTCTTYVVQWGGPEVQVRRLEEHIGKQAAVQRRETYVQIEDGSTGDRQDSR